MTYRDAIRYARIGCAVGVHMLNGAAQALWTLEEELDKGNRQVPLDSASEAMWRARSDSGTIPNDQAPDLGPD